ncbi:UDP-Glycosyltransferase/glycogen phosphorylase [Rhizophagus irregularis]|uniref:UDP-Glycosyltransferase/glycogen phosphorylase n=1 Tax=Rhizophagus irregularis TaxID=588596 RepID=A0A2N1NG34_9GLOM|nr:UDP-Glycosyltransferase/glycogen phosphorylase [Rhizophagus irregularis]
MNKRNFIFLLSIFLLILVFYVDISTSTQNHTSKNILIGSFVGGRSHVNPMLDIAVLLYERGYNVPQTLPPNIQEIGPVMSEEYPSLTPELDDFLNKHKRVLYVSFGTRFFTTIENNNKLLKAFIEAIDKKIIDGVIWTLVLTSKDDFSPTLNLLDGTEIQTSSILNNKHPHIHISKFGPQFSILNHNNTKLFLSHGGTISCHESLYTGTPMLVFPFAYDQAGNAEKLKLNGVGLILSKLNLDVNDVISKIDLLLKDENVKKNVKRLKFLSMINSKRKYRAADLIEYTLHDSHNKGTSKGFLNDWIPKARFFEGDVNIYVALLSVIFGLRLIGIGI